MIDTDQQPKGWLRLRYRVVLLCVKRLDPTIVPRAVKVRLSALRRELSVVEIASTE